jgi:hypothetical protein
MRDMTLQEIMEHLPSVVRWISYYKKDSLEDDGITEEEMGQLHELAWQLVDLTRPEEGSDADGS